MTDESQLPVRPEDGDSSLSLSKVRSGLIARGRRDAEAIARQVDPLSETRRLAEQGDAEAQYKLGWSFYEGRGVPRDYAEAAHWYRRAADQGHAEAQVKLGGMYEEDQDQAVPQDFAEAARWYRKAADQGNADAQCTLGDLYDVGLGVPQDCAEALRWYRRAADQENARAQCQLGVLFNHGYPGMLQLFFGSLCGAGQVVPQDHAEAALWYRKAAEQGDPDAQFNLGLSYAGGEGVPQDDAEAHMWLSLAASRASGEDAKLFAKRRELLANRMPPQQIAQAQSRAREWKPKTNG